MRYYGLAVKYSQQTGVVHPGVIGKVLADFLQTATSRKSRPPSRRAVDGGRRTRRWMRAHRPGQLNNRPYQHHPIGPDVGLTCRRRCRHATRHRTAEPYQVRWCSASRVMPASRTGDGVRHATSTRSGDRDRLQQQRVGMITAAQGRVRTTCICSRKTCATTGFQEALGRVASTSRRRISIRQPWSCLRRSGEEQAVDAHQRAVEPRLLSTQAFPPGTPASRARRHRLHALTSWQARRRGLTRVAVAARIVRVHLFPRYARARHREQIRRTDSRFARCFSTTRHAGSFRAFSEVRQSVCRAEFRFTWFRDVEFRVVFDARRRTLTFVNLLPGIPARSEMDRAPGAFVAMYTSTDVPLHRRVELRRRW